MSDISDQRRYYERMMDEIAAEHQKQLDQLRTENADLLEQLKYERQTSRSRLESIDILKAENAKLREYVTKLEMANIDVTARLADYIGQYDPTDAFVAEVKAEDAKLRDENARLRSCLSDDADNARQNMGENAKLRELCKMFAEYVSQDRCEGCVIKRRCNEGEVEECWQRTEIRKVARELRIEVDE